MVVLCPDDSAAKRLSEELRAFLKEDVPVLPSRELTLYDSAAVSRSWEQKRLRQLYDLAEGNTPLQIFSWESLCQRTMPKAVMARCAFRLEVGKEYAMDDRVTRLEQMGYAHCTMVEAGHVDFTKMGHHVRPGHPGGGGGTGDGGGPDAGPI